MSGDYRQDSGRAGRLGGGARHMPVNTHFDGLAWFEGLARFLTGLPSRD